MGLRIIRWISYRIIMKNKTILPGDYIAGFVDGEGCFYLTYRSETKTNRATSPKYYRWISYFAINLRKDDMDILEKIHDTLDYGKISISKDGMANYYIQNIDDLYNKVMPFFKVHSLRAKKKKDFELWCQALQVLFLNKLDRKILTLEQHQFLLSIRDQMRVIKGNFDRGYRHSDFNMQQLHT